MSRAVHWRSLVTGVAVVAGVACLTCDSNQNPYDQPENVTVSATATGPAATVRVFDTVQVSVIVHLPYLVATLTIDAGDSLRDLSLPGDRDTPDCTVMVALVFAVPDTHQVVVAATRTDGVALSQTLIIVVAGRAPVIVREPDDSISVAEGAPCTLSVSANGTGPLQYRWLKNGSIAVVDSVTYRIDSSTQSDNGTYRCIVSSAWGADTTAPIALTVMPPNWIAAPSGVRTLRQDSVLIVAWNAVARADAYRVYYDSVAYGSTARYTQIAEPYFQTDTVHPGHFVWVRAVVGSTVSAPSDTLRVAGAKPCTPLASGGSLNLAMRGVSPAARRPAMVCPEPGFYEGGTVRVFGAVRIIVE